MIVLTGAAGFIGSGVLKALNTAGNTNILLVDNLGNSSKWQNLLGQNFETYFHKNDFLETLQNQNKAERISSVIHLGACSSTTENNMEYLLKNNLEYSKSLFEFCTKRKIPFIYASSASVYGLGEFGYKDDHDEHKNFKPLNPYGFSKYLFDSWALRQTNSPKPWYGLRFFNVYGPGEDHKGFMQSVVTKARKEILETNKLKLFKSHKKEIADGEQKRDFVYVKDVVTTIIKLLKNKEEQNFSGIYNLGSGKARSFYDLGKTVFETLGKKIQIEWVDMPKNLIDQYQYFTQAPMEKLRSLPFLDVSFHSLEEGIKDYFKKT